MGLTQDKEDGPMQNRANGTPALLRKNLNVQKADVEPWQGAEETYMRVGITCFISSFITYLIIRTIHNMVQFCVPFYYQLVSNVNSQIQGSSLLSLQATLCMCQQLFLSPQCPKFPSIFQARLSPVPRWIFFPTLLPLGCPVPRWILFPTLLPLGWSFLSESPTGPGPTLAL